MSYSRREGRMGPPHAAQGSAMGAPDMAVKAKADRKPPMKAYPNLPKEDLDALVAYVLTLKK